MIMELSQAFRALVGRAARLRAEAEHHVCLTSPLRAVTCVPAGDGRRETALAVAAARGCPAHFLEGGAGDRHAAAQATGEEPGVPNPGCFSFFKMYLFA